MIRKYLIVIRNKAIPLFKFPTKSLQSFTPKFKSNEVFSNNNFCNIFSRLSLAAPLFKASQKKPPVNLPVYLSAAGKRREPYPKHLIPFHLLCDVPPESGASDP